MEFTEEIKQFAKRVVKMSSSVSNEESTKMSMIVPFFQLLGYDVFNPAEFYPEYTTDVGIKKGEKEGIKKGENRVNQLNLYLISENRFDDLERAVNDREYQLQLFQEYGL